MSPAVLTISSAVDPVGMFRKSAMSLRASDSSIIVSSGGFMFFCFKNARSPHFVSFLRPAWNFGSRPLGTLSRES
jgi:hypothetical protein